jgi:hypothetical protein
MPKTTAPPKSWRDQVLSDLSPEEFAAYSQADILARLTDAKWHIEEVMKHYPTEPMGSALDRLSRAQALLAEIAKDLAIVALEEATSKPSSPAHN